jgi:hypothetical protein
MSHHNRFLVVRLLLLATAAASFGCSAAGVEQGDDSGGSASRTPVVQDGPTGQTGTIGDGTGQVIEIDAGTGSGSTGGVVEICDGIDNDGNGIVDDLDIGNDGICDCLKIATLGKRGTWGSGDVFGKWLDSRSVNGALNLNSAVLTQELLADQQVLVVQDVSSIGRTFSADEVRALEHWVRSGGGLMTLTGYTSGLVDIDNVNKLLSPYEMNYDWPGVLLRTGQETSLPVSSFHAHPVTDGVAAIGVDNGHPVSGRNGTTIGWGSDSSETWELLRVQEVGDGRILMWADEWITYDSEWETRPDYRVELFWVNAIKWLTRPEACQVPVPPHIR